MNQLPDPELFDRYLAGECTEEEALRVRRYLAEHPDDDEIVAYFRELIEDGRVASTSMEARASLAALHKQMGARKAIDRPAPRLRSLDSFRTGRPLEWGLAAAASLVISLAGWSAWRALRPEAPVSNQATNSPVTTQQFVTQNGERSTIQLPDGSEILLNVGTRVSIPDDYGKTRRAVYIEGEARFAVNHNVKEPFLVFARGTVTRDVGTVFTVRAYAEDAHPRVAVLEGSVTLSADSTKRENIPMKAGDVGTVQEGRAIVRHEKDLTPFTGWTSGRLVFRNTPVKDALVELGRWYALDFELNDPSIRTKVLNATFEGQAIAKDVIDALAGALGTKAERHGNTIRLLPRS
jgi:transmembrane sensor